MSNQSERDQELPSLLEKKVLVKGSEKELSSFKFLKIVKKFENIYIHLIIIIYKIKILKIIIL